jgi:hypothetical protein
MMHRLIYFGSFASLLALLLFRCLALLELDSSAKLYSMGRRSIQAVLATSMAPMVFSQQVLDLSTVGWTVTSPNFANISVPGKIPSQAHLDPLYGLNDFNLRWIADSNWTYTSAPITDLFVLCHLCQSQHTVDCK